MKRSHPEQTAVRVECRGDGGGGNARPRPAAAGKDPVCLVLKLIRMLICAVLLVCCAILLSLLGVCSKVQPKALLKTSHFIDVFPKMKGKEIVLRISDGRNASKSHFGRCITRQSNYDCGLK